MHQCCLMVKTHFFKTATSEYIKSILLKLFLRYIVSLVYTCICFSIFLSGNHIPASSTACHLFTKYTTDDGQTCLTNSDMSMIMSRYVNGDLKLESKNGNPVLLSMTSCSCLGSFYIKGKYT